MAYATSNQPYRLNSGISGASLWYYADGDVDSDVDATDYFSDGSDLGMKVGDMLFHYDTAGVATLFFVSAVTAGGAATVIAATVTV